MKCLRSIRLAVCAVLLVVSTSAAAAPAPTAQLEETQRAIQESSERREQLARQAKELQEELTDLQEKMVTVAKTLRDQEEELGVTEEKLAILQTQAEEKRKDVARQQDHLAKLMSGIIRLSQTPPEAVLAMPGDHENTLRTAKVLGISTHAIEKEAVRMRDELAQMAAMETLVRKQREALAKEKVKWEKRRADLAEQLKQRKELQEKLFAQQQKEAEKLAQLTKKSSSLRDLINNLEAERRKKAARAAAVKEMRSFEAAKGKLALPVGGSIIRKYGQTKSNNETSKGILIQTRSNASVLSPFDGEVVFTGPFLTYGRLVIIRHSGGYHTLLAGLEKIECVPGQFLLEGEPIGAMGKKQFNQELYLELRRGGKPIDPGPWLRSK